ncbi:MAG: hypothetical protein L0191_18210, partial [Acidobacteria bacterium]|nr:hypothetical protein [Acidobacteriota bacterium]
MNLNSFKPLTSSANPKWATVAQDLWRITVMAVLIFVLLWAATGAWAELPPAPAAPSGASGS